MPLLVPWESRTMRNVAFPWVRWRIATHCALVAVPHGWTLSARVVEPEGISEKSHKPGDVMRWGAKNASILATLPVGLLDIRLRKGVHIS